MPNVIDHLKERGFIDAVTSEELRMRAEKPLKVYVGFDPTADSLHVGNLLGIVALGWFQRFGHTPIVVLGGATGRIGDPSGKSSERPLLDEETIRKNVVSIAKNFERILNFSPSSNQAVIVNNDEWFSPFKLVDFLRDVGKHFRVGSMLAKESVRSRLQSEEGMSYTEFSYQLLQGYDFYHLNGTREVCLQMGGSDQWGNITAGIEFTRKLSGETVYGLTWPLLTRSDGKKFGKTEEGAVWLSEKRCSPYQFYQYFVRVPDGDVINMMRMLTFLDMSAIRHWEAEMKKSSYAANSAQKKLAEEVTRMIHGEEGLEKALRVTEGASPGAKTALDPEVFQEIAKDMPHFSLKREEVIGQKLADLFAKTGLCSSKSEAVRLIDGGGAYLNNEKIQNPELRLSAEHLIGDRYLLLAAGKKKKMIVQID